MPGPFYVYLMGPSTVLGGPHSVYPDLEAVRQQAKRWLLRQPFPRPSDTFYIYRLHPQNPRGVIEDVELSRSTWTAYKLRKGYSAKLECVEEVRHEIEDVVRLTEEQILYADVARRR